MALTAYLNAEWGKVMAQAVIEPAYVVSLVEGVYAGNASLEDAWAEPLADYFLLRRAIRQFSTDFDVALGDKSFKLSQRKQLAPLFEEARAKVAWLVEEGADSGAKVVTVTDHWQTGPPDSGSEWA